MTDATLTLLFIRRFGAADRIMSLLRRRGFPVEGITIERTHQADVGRMTVAVEQAAALEQVSRHLRKLPDVIEVCAGDEAMCREYALIRIRCLPHQRTELLALLERLEARAVSVTDDHLVAEAAGPAARLDALFTELAGYEIEDSARTSPIAMSRQSSVREPSGQDLQSSALSN
jgi:acetolactate synthase-1/3 small subunit